MAERPGSSAWPQVSDIPHADVLVEPGQLGVSGTRVWIGGANSAVGTPLGEEHLRDAWVLDTCGLFPRVYREVAGRWLELVFDDLERVPPELPEVAAVAMELGDAVAEGRGPGDLFVMCQHGFNRSGLAAGLLLRRLGLSGAEAVRRLERTRPGALTNRAFRRIVAAHDLSQLIP